MFLALITMVLASILAGIIVVRALKAAMNALRANDDKGEQSPKTRQEKIEDESRSEKDKKESKEEGKAQAQEAFPEEEIKEAANLYELQNTRLDQESSKGIQEDFWMEQTDFSIDGKLCADLCVAQTPLTYLEFNNRSLANNAFFGFNLLIEDGKKMTLTYNGQAIATLTHVDKGNQSFYRTNTFPPHLSDLMIASDVDAMISARDAIHACAGDPAKVADVMMERFMRPENVNKLKRNIVMKIQAKESGLKRDISQKKPARSARPHMAS